MSDDYLLNSLLLIQETGQTLLNEKEIMIASRSRSVLIRSIVGEILFYYPNDFSKQLSLLLLKDKNPEVRSSAAIGMSYNFDEDIYQSLNTAFLNDISPMVRAYAGRSAINHDSFEVSCVNLFESALLNERSYLVRALCYCELYKKIKQERFLYHLLKCLNSKVYQTRCATINSLDDILNKANAILIYQAVENVIKKEKVEIVVDSALALREKSRNMIGSNTVDG